MLTLLRLAGECMPDAAFQRLVALVEANPALHENSARAAFQVTLLSCFCVNCNHLYFMTEFASGSAATQS